MLVGLGRKHMNLHFSVTEPAPEYAFFHGNGQHSFGREEQSFSLQQTAADRDLFPDALDGKSRIFDRVEHGGEQPGYDERHSAMLIQLPGSSFPAD